MPFLSRTQARGICALMWFCSVFEKTSVRVHATCAVFVLPHLVHALSCWSERPCKWCMVDNCAAPANLFGFRVLNDASDGAPSRKETSHVLVRLQLRRDVKSIQQPFHTHAKNQINALRILSEIAEKPFRPVPQNFGFGLLRFTLQLPASHCTSFL